MELLITNKRPIYVEENDFSDAFEQLSLSADSIRISTGFISVDSLQYLLENIKIGALPYIDLTIGMHAFDGFTKTQYDAAHNLASFLKDQKKGSVSICVAFPFHGKIYVFYKSGKPFSAIIGSSNLSSLGEKKSYNLEVDIIVEEPVLLKKLIDLQTQLKNKASEAFENWEPKRFNEEIFIPGAEKLSGKETADCWKLKRISEFLIPLKTESKSNLNVFFGKGRENKKRLIRPRPWYEAELIVSKTITQLPGYPCKTSFRVITDDGWSFFCRTSGDFSKNFRSENDLCILGAWIKGKFESAGLLKVGEPVTTEILEKYGSNHLKLIKTENPNFWLLEFGNNRGTL